MDKLSSWETILSGSITLVGDLPSELDANGEMLDLVVERYPMRINPYYLGLIKHKDDPIFLQCVPKAEEISLDQGYEDPLNEEESSPAPGLTHRYPDRVLFLISSRCA
ncbi:MAG TPA: lysine 2,3-aminomutase, partial [Deltaproteobacteria bacterium]|nr:lysine 2,3-aminomutase [Deltaproteobacteria bacterium]